MKKQEPHGPHRSPEKTVQINKHKLDYIITLIKLKKIYINFMIIYCFFIWIPTQGCFVPKLVKIGSVVLETRFFLISSKYFRYFVIICPWKRVGTLNLNNTWIPFTQESFVLCSLEIHSSDMSLTIIHKFLKNQIAADEIINVMTPYCPTH